MKRLNRAARRVGMSRQRFVESAVLSEIADVEERKAKRDDTRAKALPKEKVAPAGFGLHDALAKRREEEADASLEVSPERSSAPVVVNVGASQPGGDAVDRLATWIAKGSDLERMDRRRRALGILEQTAADVEEAKVLVARLDAAIAHHLTSSQSSTVRAARLGFGRLMELFK